jgi:hypothetical protein
MDVSAIGTHGQQFTQGAHAKHMGGAGGPPATTHAADCTYCHGIKSVTGASAGCSAELCHPGGGSDLPGGASDVGWASFPSTSHVEGNYAVDFQDQARAWNWYDEYTSAKPSPAAGGLATTDICDRCHSTQDIGGGKVGATLAKSGWAAPSQLDCATCHNTAIPAYTTPVSGGTSAPIVATATGAGTHLKAATGDSLGGSTNWTVQCTKCHSGHAGEGAGSVTVPTPPSNWTNAAGESHVTGNMQTVLGIEYRTGINLGGSGTVASINTKTTEAEICWGCHDANGVSEWGYNTKTTPAGFPVVQFPTATDGTAETFDFGWIYQGDFTTRTSDWTAGYWKDQYDPLLRRRVTSVHTAYLGTDAAGRSSSVAQNVDASGRMWWSPGFAGTGSLEPKSYIRCSYCHDVHELGRAQGDTKAGKPYLRGSWMGNPYPPDMPPRNGYSYPTTGGAGGFGNRMYTEDFSASGGHARAVTPVAMPRLYTGATSQGKGGHFIDQNSGDPTGGRDVAGTAGLCALCHGSGVDGMDYYAGSKLWLYGNGHANSTLGGTGAGASNLFSGAWGREAVAVGHVGSGFMAGQDGVGAKYADNWSLGGGSAEIPWAGVFSNGAYRGACSWAVPGQAQTQRCPPRNTGWYGADGAHPVEGNSARGTDYATWYLSTGALGGAAGVGGGQGPGTRAHKFTCSKCHTPHASGLPALLTTNCLDRGLATWTTAGGQIAPGGVTTPTTMVRYNWCHRKASNGDGWNRLAPGQNQ